MDTVAIPAILDRMHTDIVEFDRFAFRDDQKSLIAAIEDVHDERPRHQRDHGFHAALGRLGYAVVDNCREVLALVAFLGEVLVKLLRLLQEGEYYPLGSDQPRRIKARVVVATHADLAAREAAGFSDDEIAWLEQDHSAPTK